MVGKLDSYLWKAPHFILNKQGIWIPLAENRSLITTLDSWIDYEGKPRSTFWVPSPCVYASKPFKTLVPGECYKIWSCSFPQRLYQNHWPIHASGVRQLHQFWHVAFNFLVVKFDERTPNLLGAKESVSTRISLYFADDVETYVLSDIKIWCIYIYIVYIYIYTCIDTFMKMI